MKTVPKNVYRENRASIPLETLRKLEGQWVAFSADRTRVVASASTIAELSTQVSTVNEDLRDVVLEHIQVQSADANLGAAEFM